MTLKRIYRVKITRCSLNFMWYRDYIGLELECELLKNLNTLFLSYTDSPFSYRSIQPIKTKRQILFKTIQLPNGIEKYIQLTEPEWENIERMGWILEEDVEVLNLREEIL